MAGSISLSWNASTSPEAAGYKVYYGESSSNYTSSIDVGNQTSTTIPELQEGIRYYFATTAYNAAQTSESGFSNEVTAVAAATAPPTVDFSASQTTGEAPLTVSFSATANGSIDTWDWNFGDPSIASISSPSPEVTFQSPGTYTVSLTVHAANGSVTETKTNLINVTDSGAVPPVDVGDAVSVGVGLSAESGIGVFDDISIDQVAADVEIGFESPAYVAGLPVSGQDGWTVNAYIQAPPGDAVVLGSGTESLLGSQSLSIGNPATRMDIAKSDLFVLTGDGTADPDVEVSYLHKTTATGGHNGIYFSDEPSSGKTSGWVRIEGDRIVALSSEGFQTVGDYVTGETVEFLLAIDVDHQVYSVSARNQGDQSGFVLLTSVPLEFWDPLNTGPFGLGLSADQGVGIFDGLKVTQSQPDVTIDFEAPGYNANLAVVGQQGWVASSSSQGSSEDAVIAAAQGAGSRGAQSLVIGSSSGRIDIAKANILEITGDGSTTPDLKISYLHTTTATAGHNGLFFSADPTNGTTSGWVRIEGDRIVALSATGFEEIGNYTAGSDMELLLSVDVDTQVYTVSVRDPITEPHFRLLTQAPLNLWDPLR